MKHPSPGKTIIRIFFILLILLLLSIYIHYRYWYNNWKTDLAVIEQQYIHQDIQLDHDTDRANTFIRQLNTLTNKLPSYYPDDDQVKIGIMQALTRVGQLHNSIQFSQTTNMLPFRLYLQDSKLYVIAASSAYQQVMYTELTDINGHPAARIIEQLRPLIPHDHEQDLRGLIPSYVLLPDILHGLHIITNKQQIPLTFLDKQGTVIHLTAAPIPISHMRETVRSPATLSPAPASDHQYNYSFTIMDNEHTLYMNYKLCADDPSNPATQFIMDVQDRIHNLEIYKFIIDLRGNSGGDENVMLPLFDILKNSPSISQRIIVLVDRYTASSAMFHAVTLRNELHATIIGEPAMGDPNAPGDILPFTLPNSQLTIYYCTQDFQRAAYSIVEPDIHVLYTVDDMQKGNDPVLQKALHYDK
ncbi:S41 family peptidase [Paenibacillus shenyangensis]|uniref:S41 family peptidase n=1 Tax=Paenibacillus sp. A9 TaxID=1284352 RepID=UPI0003628AF4|nr:S41 family peptidase [Paenibacillus sp. A9]